MKEKLEKLSTAAKAAMRSASTAEDLQEVQNKFFGKKGELTLISKELGKAKPEDRPALDK